MNTRGEGAPARQCAAVSTQVDEINDPPQKELLPM
jgi:hypothetical protein